jgi:hypothetical protein
MTSGDASLPLATRSWTKLFVRHPNWEAQSRSLASDDVRDCLDPALRSVCRYGTDVHSPSAFTMAARVSGPFVLVVQGRKK